MIHNGVLIALVLGVAFVAPRVGAAPLYSTDFESDPVQAGWVCSPQVGPANWSESIGRNASRCIFTREGAWDSPMIPVTPGKFYKSEFYAKVTPRQMPSGQPKITDPRSREEFPAYWAVFYYDKTGKMLDSDHYWGLDLSSGWTRREYVTCAKPGAATMRIHFQPIMGTGVRVDDFSVTEISAADTASWSDALYSTMPSFHFPAPSRRGHLIPQTMKKLRQGGNLRVVMIGDSISNDTANSQWHTLVGRKYPKCHIELIPAVRGGTFIGWFAEPDHVKERVLDNKPDLLIIASLNHGKDPEAVRSIIKQTRAACGAEILLLTPAVGSYDVTVEKDWKSPLDANGTRQCDALYKVALEEKVEFIDIGRTWGDYIVASGKPYRWYLRDFVHANQRGAEILARTIEAYLAP